MTSFVQSIALIMPATRTATRTLGMAALMGATILASSLTPARAADAPVVQTPAAAAATDARPDTVEQRITSLHTSLKITAEQETKWTAVAHAMRENAVAMEKMVTENKAIPANTMTAVDDLKKYQKFAQAHVDGLKNILASFETLYSAMPDAQKKVADTVFEMSEHHTLAARG